MQEPYIIIEDFFSAAPLSHYRKYILSMLHAANSDKYWKKSDPGSLLHFQEKMEDLMNAAQLLLRKTSGKKSKKEKGSIAPEVFAQETIDPKLYSRPNQGQTLWESFPRSLSKREFIDPRLVFDQFFKFKSRKEWSKDLKEIVMYALSPNSCSEVCIDFDFLKINEYLQKLVEAAHLIEVREINRDENKE